ncbi:MAG: peptide chain release factor N(5)-glutamine methyltransferase [Rhodospirillales bacterium]|nr:peptide chain release factor N(5)-glutamine methyltransferase [Rhodospirillales bacterium]
MLGELFDDAVRALSAAGIDGARLDVRLLAGAAFDLTAAQALSRRDSVMDGEKTQHFLQLVARRAAREPMAHILGSREFWSLPFDVSADTLIPRPDTETLVQAALDWAKGREGALRVLDLGTGTGCILLSLLSEWPNARGVGVDINPGAVDVARANAQTLGMGDRTEFMEGNWAAGLEQPFDVIVANPPYIPASDLAGLEPEVSQFEPKAALSGGPDGLGAYRALAPQMALLLDAGGAAFVEIGFGQSDSVSEIFASASLEVAQTHRDLGNIVRCLTLKRGIIPSCTKNDPLRSSPRPVG